MGPAYVRPVLDGLFVQAACWDWDSVHSPKLCRGEAVIRPFYAAYARCIYRTLPFCIKVAKIDIWGKQEACHKNGIAAKCCSTFEQIYKSTGLA